MKRQMLRALFVVGLVAGTTTIAGANALFTDTVYSENNTFTTGSLQLKLFYDCRTVSGANASDLVTQTYNSGTVVGSMVLTPQVGAKVKCGTTVSGNGLGEREALAYTQNITPLLNDGASLVGMDIYNLEAFPTRWTAANNWYDGLSSPMDWTNIYPGWKTTAAAVTSPVAGEGDLISLGNAGSLPISDVNVVATLESQDAVELAEPLDGAATLATVPGGNRVDPLTDADWLASLGTAYSVPLASQINVTVQRVDASEAVISTLYSSTLAGLVAGADLGFTTVAPFNPNQVAYLRFNWSLNDVDNTYQGKMIDYQIRFDAAQ